VERCKRQKVSGGKQKMNNILRRDLPFVRRRRRRRRHYGRRLWCDAIVVGKTNVSKKQRRK
jgi:hypothetical protein